MKDIKHIRRDFHWVPWVIPKGFGLGVLGVKNLFSEHGHVAYQIKGDGWTVAQDRLNNFTLQSNW